MTKQHIFIIENNIQKVGQSLLDLLVRRQFSLVQDNRTNVNVEAWTVYFGVWRNRENKNVKYNIVSYHILNKLSEVYDKKINA
jgi:hypothetical protein